jgi:hypothetical protein
MADPDYADADGARRPRADFDQNAALAFGAAAGAGDSGAAANAKTHRYVNIPEINLDSIAAALPPPLPATTRRADYCGSRVQWVAHPAPSSNSAAPGCCAPHRRRRSRQAAAATAPFRGDAEARGRGRLWAQRARWLRHGHPRRVRQAHLPGLARRARRARAGARRHYHRGGRAPAPRGVARRRHRDLPPVRQRARAELPQAHLGALRQRAHRRRAHHCYHRYHRRRRQAGGVPEPRRRGRGRLGRRRCAGAQQGQGRPGPAVSRYCRRRRHWAHAAAAAAPRFARLRGRPQGAGPPRLRCCRRI